MDFDNGKNRRLLDGEKMSGNGINKKMIAIVVLVFLITNIGSFIAGNNLSVFFGTTIGASSTENSKFKKLFEVKQLLEQQYYGEIDEDALVEGAIKGMVSAVGDPYTVFMDAEEYTEFSTQTEGNYVGLGLQVGVKNDKITVIAPFEDSPAAKAGILSGDVIEKIGDKEVTGADLELAVSMMKGKEGETVNVTVFRENKGSFELSMKREVIEIVTVKGQMLEGNIAYIQLSMFDENTSEKFTEELTRLKNEGAKGLILDLRGNPGGLMNRCLEIASNFVEQGQVLLTTKDKNGNESVMKSQGGIAIGMPLVVLVDEGSASASEILAGIIRDYKAGILVGTTTYGKGIVQSLEDTGDGTALKVTTYKYFIPSGEDIHKVGIKPDVEVTYPIELKEKEYSLDKDPQFTKGLELIKEKMK